MSGGSDDEQDGGFVNPALAGMLDDEDDEDGAFVMPSLAPGTDSEEEDRYGGGEVPAATNSVDLLSSMLAGVDMTDAMRKEPEPEPEVVVKKVKKKSKRGGKNAAVERMKAMRMQQNASEAGPAVGGAGEDDGGEEEHIDESSLQGFLRRKRQVAEHRRRENSEEVLDEVEDADEITLEISEVTPMVPERPPAPAGYPARAALKGAQRTKTLTVNNNGSSAVQMQWQGEPRPAELEEKLRALLHLPASQDFNLIDPSDGASVVLSASIPSGLSLTLEPIIDPAIAASAAVSPTVATEGRGTPPAFGGSNGIAEVEAGNSSAGADAGAPPAADGEEGGGCKCIVM